jgi:hydrogenase nickel incorporation protein HypA/HybF
MHETAVAQSLVDVICQEAQKRHARPVRAKMSCGQLNAVNDDVLTFAFEAIAQGTPCEGLRLQIEHKPLQGRCRKCGQVFAVDLSKPMCPSCGAEDFELLPDAPLILEEIEFEEGTDDGESERRKESAQRQ